MSTVLILVFLIATPVWLIHQFFKIRPYLEQKEQSVDPLTGVLYFEAQAQAHQGLKD